MSVGTDMSLCCSSLLDRDLIKNGANLASNVFKLLKIEIQLIYNVVLISGIQQSDSVIHTYIYIYIYLLFQILFHYRLLQDTEYRSLSYRLGPFCLSVLYKVVYI